MDVVLLTILPVGLFNKGDKPAKISINPRMLGLYDGTRTVRDLWRQKDVGHLTDDTGKGRFTTEVAPHGVALLKVYPGNSDKRYTKKVTYAK